MKLQRRDFLKLGIAQALVIGTASKVASAQPQIFPRQGLSILQGATDSSKTQFSILNPVSQTLYAFVTDSLGRRYEADSLQSSSFGNHPEKITKAYFSGLRPNENFVLNVVDSSGQSLLDQREFGLLDVNKPAIRFAICSCMNEANHEPEIWRNMVANKPDVLFFIGDSVYADTGAPRGGADPAYLWKRFCEARNTLEIYFSKRLVPILATWDDHDFGLNDTNCHEYKWISESQKNFQTFFAQDVSHCGFLEKGPGVSSAFRYQNQLFLLLDDRSYRDVRGSKDRFAHWGREQETWMLNLIARNSGPTWMMNGSQIFPAMPFKESVSNDHKVQFEGIKDELKKSQSKVVFVTGDVHYSEISQIESEAVGYPTYELTSSSIHSTNIPGAPDIFPNSRRIASTGKRNYIMVDAVENGPGVQFKATSYSSSNQVKFELKLQV